MASGNSIGGGTAQARPSLNLTDEQRRALSVHVDDFRHPNPAQRTSAPSFLNSRARGGGGFIPQSAPQMVQQPQYQQPQYAPQQYQQPRNMMGGHRTYGRDRYSQVDNRALNRELQMRRSAGRVASQAAPNLYNPGADTQAVSAVFGNEIGMGNNDPYLLHQLRGGGYAVNRGLIDPTLVNLTGDYSKWIT